MPLNLYHYHSSLKKGGHKGVPCSLSYSNLSSPLKTKGQFRCFWRANGGFTTLWFGAMACRPWLRGPASFSTFILNLSSSISCLISTPHSGHAPSHSAPSFLLFPVLGCLSSSLVSLVFWVLRPIRGAPLAPSWHHNPILTWMWTPVSPVPGTGQPALAALWQGGPSCLLCSPFTQLDFTPEL